MFRKALLFTLLLLTCSTANAFTPAAGQPYYVYNPGHDKLTHWRAAQAAVKAGTSDAREIILGTSTAEGYCSVQDSWGLSGTPAYLIADGLTTRYGVNADTFSYFGYTAADGLGRTTNDVQVTLSGVGAGGTYSLGGPQAIMYSTGNSIVFTPKNGAGTAQAVDTFDIWHGKESGSGTCSWSLDGGAATNFSNSTTTTAVGHEIVSTTLATHTLTVKYVSGDRCQIIGVEAHNSATKHVSVINSGFGGVVAANWDWSAAGKAFGMPQVMNVISPDLLTIWMNNNDALVNTNDTAYKASIQKQITQVKTTNTHVGDVVLVAQVPYGAGAGNLSYIAAKIQDLKDLALTNGIILIILPLKWTSYTAFNTAGLACGDDLHQNPAGHAVVARIILDVTGGAQ